MPIPTIGQKQHGAKAGIAAFCWRTVPYLSIKFISELCFSIWLWTKLTWDLSSLCCLSAAVPVIRTYKNTDNFAGSTKAHMRLVQRNSSSMAWTRQIARKQVGRYKYTKPSSICCTVACNCPGIWITSRRLSNTSDDFLRYDLLIYGSDYRGCNETIHIVSG